MITLKIPLSQLVIDPHEDRDLSRLPEEELIPMLQRAYAFLSPALSVSLCGGQAIIQAPIETPDDDGPRRDLRRAGNFAGSGRYKRAIELLHTSPRPCVWTRGTNGPGCCWRASQQNTRTNTRG